METCEEENKYCPDMSGLTEEEKVQVLDVLKRAKAFQFQEEKQLQRQPLQGQLSKYTNMVKGWQVRYFILDPINGRLNYYEKEEHKITQRPRGTVPLSGAVIYPSEEDSKTFHINASNGVSFQLKASDTKERQYWIDRMRATVEYQEELHVKRSEAISQKSISNVERPNNCKISNSASSIPDAVDNNYNDEIHENILPKSFSDHYQAFSVTEKDECHHAPNYSQEYDGINIYTCNSNRIKQASDMIDKTSLLNTTLVKYTNNMNNKIHDYEKDLLILKAISTMTVNCLQNSLSSLVQHKSELLRNATLQQPTTEWYYSIPNISTEKSSLSTTEFDECQNFNSEIEDDSVSIDINNYEENKSFPSNTISALKLGADLTSVSLTEYPLANKSWLEYFADFNSRPNLFLEIVRCETPGTRIKAIVKWYLTGFYCVYKTIVFKKPINPVVGETFKCSWLNGNDRVDCLVEQLSRHPPITGIYIENRECGICLNANICSKVKFMGNFIGISLIGNVRIRLKKFNEEYIISLPSVFIRSILTTPWLELGDKISIKCEKSNYSAFIQFHSRNINGTHLHNISGQIFKDGQQNCIWKINGKWTGNIDMTSDIETSESFDNNQLIVIKKRVKMIDCQDDMESRRLWKNYIECLNKNNYDEADNLKTQIVKKYSLNTNENYKSKFFERKKESGDWLCKTMMEI